MVKAWRLGEGWVIYAGVGILPEDRVFASPDTWDDRAVWQQFIRSVASIRTNRPSNPPSPPRVG